MHGGRVVTGGILLRHHSVAAGLDGRRWQHLRTENPLFGRYQASGEPILEATDHLGLLLLLGLVLPVRDEPHLE